ncbi:putative gamma-glutamylcyclotransferase CG2811, partial [Glossina fuscipes]|uniref:Gamma-glutamylcyclotransferase family protein n=1 Tax=Glossina fuscipes TaxID=7396 RepID=A0A9C5Z5T7_9MUSC
SYKCLKCLKYNIFILFERYPLIISTRFNIPFLLNKCGRGHNVKGEVYEVDEEMLKKLDELQEYPEYYDREIQEIRMEKKDEVEKCWLYLMRNCPDHLLQKPLLVVIKLSR